MLRKENYINRPDDILHYLLKLFSMFKIRLWYDEIIVREYVLDTVGIICIDCSKNVCCTL